MKTEITAQGCDTCRFFFLNSVHRGHKKRSALVSCTATLTWRVRSSPTHPPSPAVFCFP